MVKSNTPSRDMRALQRDRRKITNELVQSKRNAVVFKKMVSSARDKAIVKFIRLYKKEKTLEEENRLLLASLKNFNVTCNQQKMTIRKQAHGIQVLQKSYKELQLLKRGLCSIHNARKRNPYLIRKVDI